MPQMSTKQRLLKRREALRTKRARIEPHWKEIARYIAPRRYKSGKDDDVSAQGRIADIYNNTASLDLRRLASGIMTGLTSPARQWRRLSVAALGLARNQKVRRWLHETNERMSEIFARSNLYNILEEIYEDVGGMGTACLLIDEDEEDVIRAYSMLAGTYYIAANARGRIDTLYREVELTIEQLVEKFGLDRASPTVRMKWEAGALDDEVLVLHVIEPDRDHEPGKLFGRHGFPWRSIWLEVESAMDDVLLEESGYRSQPFMAPRWSAASGEEYGYCQAMEALGDVRGLQKLELEKAKAAWKINEPPMLAPDAIRNGRVSLIPGDVTYYPQSLGAKAVSPAMVLPPDALTVYEASIREAERRIDAALFADLWLATLSRRGQQPLTAREVEERHEEKLLQLGPVVERLNDELLDPLVDRVFDIMLRAGEIPRPPEELEGVALRVEYLSIMSQAQRMVGYGGFREFLGLAAELAQLNGEVADRVEWDRALTVAADMLGVSPEIIRADDEVAAMRAARAQQEQYQQMLASSAQLAKSARDLGGVDMGEDNAAARLIQGMSPVAAAQVGEAG